VLSIQPVTAHNLSHIHGNTLDLMLTSNDDLLDNISVCSNNNNPISSDHYPIVFSLSHARPLPTSNLSQHVYDYSKANFPEINSYIFNFNILNCLHFCDVKTSWAIIKSVIYEAMTLFIPKFESTPSNTLSGLLRSYATKSNVYILLEETTSNHHLIIMQHI